MIEKPRCEPFDKRVDNPCGNRGDVFGTHGDYSTVTGMHEIQVAEIWKVTRIPKLLFPMEIDISLSCPVDVVAVRYQSGVERLAGYIRRHREVKKENLTVREFEAVLLKKPRNEDFYIAQQHLKNVSVEMTNNDLCVFVDLQPFQTFTVHFLFNSEQHVERTEIVFGDEYFRISEIHIKLFVRPPQMKKRFSLFNR